jgi:hypothetical protein
MKILENLISYEQSSDNEEEEADPFLFGSEENILEDVMQLKDTIPESNLTNAVNTGDREVIQIFAVEDPFDGDIDFHFQFESQLKNVEEIMKKMVLVNFIIF